MRILFAASEADPFFKSGGLADVASSLPRALAALGHEVAVVLPLYRSVDRAARGLAPAARSIHVPLGGETAELKLHRAQLPGSDVPVWLLENDALFADAYGGSDHELAARYVAFSRAIVALLTAGAPISSPIPGAPPESRFDALHLNDWQTGLAATYCHYAPEEHVRRTGTVFTIHNLAYQGAFHKSVYPLVGLDWKHFNMHELEFFDTVCLLKAGLAHADVLTTVSERYAREILTPEAGNGLDALLRARQGELFGVLNGIDTDEWNPETDKKIPARYSSRAMSPKELCRSALMREVGLPRGTDDVPLIGIISRFAAQKGLDLVLEKLDALLSRARLVVLGGGEAPYEKAFREAARTRPDRIAVTIGYDDSLAHRIEGGADFLLMPSRYEPCGLSQMYSLRYGTVPIVRATGGLDDTVIDDDADPEHGNGFKFDALTGDAMLAAVDRAMLARRAIPRFAAIRSRGMAADFSWTRAAKRYAELYERALGIARNTL